MLLWKLTEDWCYNPNHAYMINCEVGLDLEVPLSRTFRRLNQTHHRRSSLEMEKSWRNSKWMMDTHLSGSCPRHFS